MGNAVGDALASSTACPHVPKGRGPARRARPQIHRTLPDRAKNEARAFLSKQQPPRAAALPCRHIVLLPVVRTASAPLRGCSRQNVAIPPARSTTRPYSYPVRLAGARRPRDHDALFGAVRRSGRRDPSGRTVPQSAANHATLRSHALPGFPKWPRRAARVSGVQCTPLKPATGWRLPAPARR